MLRWLTILSFLGFPIIVDAQTSITNKGVDITINTGAVFYISGDYTDSGSSADGSLDTKGGTLELGGDLIKNGSGNAVNNANIGNDGTISFVGSNQQITGTSPDPEYFSHLEVSGGLVTSTRDLDIQRSVKMTAGDLNLQTNKMKLIANDSMTSEITNESSTNRIYGNGSVIEHTRTIAQSAFDIGLGIAFTPSIGASFIDSTSSIHRFHSTQFGVADDAINRYYRIDVPVADSIENITLAFDDNELNGVNIGDLAIYFTNNGGGSWVKLGSGTASGGTINATESMFLEAGVGMNYITLANKVCATLPNTFSSIPPIDLTPGEVDICFGDDLTLSASSTHYEWDAEVDSLDLVNQSIILNSIDSQQAGDFTLYERDAKGCERTQTYPVNVRRIPEAAFVDNSNSGRVCTNYALTFTSINNTEDGQPISNYQWDFGDGLIVNTTLTSYPKSYPNDSIYTVTLTTTSYYGCVGSPIPGIREILDPPQLNFSLFDANLNPISAECEELPVNFNASAVFEIGENDYSGTIVYDWDFGDGNGDPHDPSASPTDFNSSTAHSYQYTSGTPTYTIDLSGQPDQVSPNGCMSTYQGPIDIYPKPDLSFQMQETQSGDPLIDEVCQGVLIDFMNTSSIEGPHSIVSYHWNLDGDSTSTVEDPTFQYPDAGTYLPGLTGISDQGCIGDTTNVNLIVHSAPTGTISATPQQVCLGEPIQFNNNSTIPVGSINFDWDFGNGNSSSDFEPIYTYLNGGSFEVNLTRTSTIGDCSNEVTTQVSVREYLGADFIVDNVCDGETVFFFDQSGEGQDVSYFWDFGDGNTSTERNPQHDYNILDFGGDSEKTFFVDLTVTNHSNTTSCDSTISKQATIFRNPEVGIQQTILTFSPDTLLDINLGDHFVPVGSTIVWKNSTGGTLSTNTTVIINETGTFQVGVLTPALCSKSFPFSVFLLEPVDLGVDQVVCKSVTLDATPQNSPIAPSNYKWYQDGLLIQDGTTPSYEVLVDGTYRVEVTYEVLGESKTTSDEINITIGSEPVLDLDGTYAVCPGDSLNVDTNILADSYSWYDPGGNLISSSSSAWVSESGDHLLTITQGPCETSAIFLIKQFNQPVAGFIQSDDQVCLGEEIVFESLSTSGSLIWAFGDGTSSTDSLVVKNYITEGNYDVLLTLTSPEGCIDTVTSQVTVEPVPNVDFFFEDSCPGDTISFSNHSTISSGTLSYEWGFGDGNNSNDTTPFNVYSVSGTYQVSLTASSSFCSASKERSVTVFSVPTLDFDDQIVTCGSSIAIQSPSAAVYRWYDPANDATISTQDQIEIFDNTNIGLELTSVDGCTVIDESEIVLNTPINVDLGIDRVVCDEETLNAGFFPDASYTWSTGDTHQSIITDESGVFAVTVTDQNGCMGSDEVTLQVNPTPNVYLGEDVTACDGESIVLDGSPGYESYSWNTGSDHPFIQADSTGLYTLQVTENGCSGSDDIQVTFNPVPVVDFSVDYICLGELADFQNQTSISSGEFLSYAWDFGDGGQSPIDQPDYQYNAPGNYDVRLEATSESGCMAEVIKSIEIRDPPQSNFLIDGHCVGEEIVFSNLTDEGSDTVNYKWDFGDGVVDFEMNPTHIYSANDQYFVRLTTRNELGCESIKLKSHSVRASPSPILENLVSTCLSELTLDAGNPGSSYLWSNNAVTSTINISTEGQYWVEISSAEGCVTTDSIYVEFLESGTPDLGPDRAECGLEVLDPNIQAFTYIWSTGETSSTISAENSETFWVETLTSDLCMGQDTVHLVIHDVPVVDLGPDQFECEGNEILLEVDYPAVISWSNGDTTAQTYALESGTYYFNAVDENGCEFSDEINITFHENPQIEIEDVVTGCNFLQLSAENPNSEYLWSTGSILSSILIDESGSYDVRVTNQYGCTVDKAFEVAILDSPAIGAGPDLDLCFGESATIDVAGTETGDQFQWSNGLSASSIQVDSEGWRWVEVTNEEGCVSRDSLYVDVADEIIIGLQDEMVLCASGPFDLTPLVEAASYLWDSDVGISSDQKTMSSEIPGTYWVEAMDIRGCKASDTISVVETTEKIESSFLLPSEVLVGERVQFAALTEPYAESYFWSFGDGARSSSRNPTYIYANPGTYEVSLFVSNSTCSDEMIKTITVRPNSARFDAVESDVFRLIEIVEMEVYPNPSSERVSIGIELNYEAKASLTIFDMRGFQVFQHSFRVLDDDLEIDLFGLKEGLYMINLQVGRQLRTKRLVKSH